MIAEIIKAPSVKGMIGYNESKVEQGLASRIYNSVNTTDRLKMEQVLNLNVELNSRLRKNKFQHVVVSFHKDDSISNDQFLKVWNRYN